MESKWAPWCKSLDTYSYVICETSCEGVLEMSTSFSKQRPMEMFKNLSKSPSKCENQNPYGAQASSLFVPYV
jgi:hypothetical protein